MTVTAKSIQNYQVETTSRSHTWIADEPQSVGGDDTGPNPYDLLLGSLAACKLITVQMYAQRKGWPLEGMEIRLETQKIHARDSDKSESRPSALIDLIEGEISFQGDLSPEQLDRLHEISNRCPVHRTLTSETIIEVNLSDRSQR